MPGHPSATGSTMSDSKKFRHLMVPVARHYWGPENHAQSNRRQLRWGTNGSRSVSVEKGVWHDHENQEGGGVVDLLRKEEGAEADVPEILERVFGLPRNSDGAAVKSEIVFDYVNLQGEVMYQAVRVETHYPDKETTKTYTQRRMVEGRPVPGMTGVTALPYRLPELDATPIGKVVFICEGEKAVEAIRHLGLVATTNHGGAGKWWDSLTPHFTGRKVVILPDNDQAGERHLQKVGTALTGTANSIRVLRLPDLPPKGDAHDWVQAGGTRDQLIALVKTALPFTPQDVADEPADTTQTPPRRITLIPWGELPEMQVRWLVKDLVPAQGFAALYGKPGTYKSFVALYTAAMIATGRPCFDRETVQGDVVYLAGEGGAGLKQRRDALAKHYGLEASTRVHFIRAQLNLRSTDEDTDALIAAVTEASLKPALLIIDTLARAFSGGNENSSEDMGAFISHCGRIQETLQTGIMIVHHSGKDEAKGQRGHSSLLGAVDTELEVVKLTSEDAPADAPKIGQMTVTKQKDGEDGFKIPYRMEPITLSPTGLDETRGSLVVVPDNTAQKRRGRSLNANAKAVFAALKMAFDEGNGQLVGLHQVPAGAKCVNVNMWRTYWYAACPQERDTARKYFSRGLKDLVESGTIGTWSENVWISEA